MNAIAALFILNNDQKLHPDRVTNWIAPKREALKEIGIDQIAVFHSSTGSVSSFNGDGDSLVLHFNEDVVNEEPSFWQLGQTMEMLEVHSLLIIHHSMFSGEDLVPLLDVHRACASGYTISLSPVKIDNKQQLTLNAQGRVHFAGHQNCEKKRWYWNGTMVIDRKVVDHLGGETPLLTLSSCFDVAISNGEVSGCPKAELLDHGLVEIDQSWTLFLDRDGVINDRIMGGYIQKPEQFVFLPGVVNALKNLRPLFGRIVVVTNQQGIGKGIMTSQDLSVVHHRMTDELAKHQIIIDSIYFCPELAGDHPICRKPLPGMAFQAIEEFPEINFSRSVIVGDSRSDIQFGRRLGMVTVKIGEATGIEDIRIDSLSDFPTFIQMAQ